MDIVSDISKPFKKKTFGYSLLVTILGHLYVFRFLRVFPIFFFLFSCFIIH